MALNLMDYDASPVKPLLKVLIFGLSVGAIFIFQGAKIRYGGRFKKILNYLSWSFTFFAAGAFVRYMGHGIEYGFTKDLSLKWFQSIFIVVSACLFAYAGKSFMDLEKSIKSKE